MTKRKIVAGVAAALLLSANVQVAYAHDSNNDDFRKEIVAAEKA